MKNKKHTPSKEEIAAAIKKFRKSGGIIKKLPAQKFSGSAMVGEDKHGAYESIHAFSSLL